MKMFCTEEGGRLKLKFDYDEKTVQVIKNIKGREYIHMIKHGLYLIIVLTVILLLMSLRYV